MTTDAIGARLSGFRLRSGERWRDCRTECIARRVPLHTFRADMDMPFRSTDHVRVIRVKVDFGEVFDQQEAPAEEAIAGRR